MWSIVKFVDSNDYCVVRNDQVSNLKGKNVDIVYGGSVLYTSSSKLACGKECEKLLNAINSSSHVNSDEHITRVEPPESSSRVDRNPLHPLI